MKIFISLVATALFSLHVSAAELSADAIAGKWFYERIVAEDYAMDVNLIMEFQPDGTVIHYAPNGTEIGRATFQVTPGTIMYSDDKGQQIWEVLLFDATSLQVDHRGANMFFTRQP